LIGLDELAQMLGDLLHDMNLMGGLDNRHAALLGPARVNALSHFDLALGAPEHFVNVAHGRPP
jgi:hypothetical protein